jgi:two-component system invasion response regulator UvrY
MLKILIVDDHPVVRSGLAQVLSAGFPTASVSESSNAAEALERIWKERWDVVIADISLPGKSGLDLLKEIKQECPKLPVLILSMHTEDQFAVRALRNGAAGYLTKETASQELLMAVQKALEGGKYIRPSLAEKLALHLELDTQKLPHEGLSDREFQVLRLIASGRTAKEIASDLSLSIKTISTYRSRILDKMQMRNNSELMRYALQNHLLLDTEAARPFSK